VFACVARIPSGRIIRAHAGAAGVSGGTAGICSWPAWKLEREIERESERERVRERERERARDARARMRAGEGDRGEGGKVGDGLKGCAMCMCVRTHTSRARVLGVRILDTD